MPRSLVQTLRALALKLPGVEEGVACKGTAIESITIKARGKAFLFLNQTHARLKLGASFPEAAGLATRHPARYQAGAGGWARITLNLTDPPPINLLRRWIDESHRLLTSQEPMARPSARGRAGAPGSKRGPRKKTARR